MKKLLFIICFMPLFSYGGTIYKILSDTVFIGSIPYRTATGELLLFNATKDTTESVLYNTGNGKTEFKKVRLIRQNDSTYVFKIGTTIIGDTIKIKATSGGGGISQSTLNDTASVLNARINAKGFGSVTSVATGIGLSGGTITSSGTLIVDTTTIVSKSFLTARGYTSSIGTVTSVATDNTLTGGTITISGTLKVDTTVISTKGNVTGLLLAKQNTLTFGTGVVTYLAQTRAFQTLTDGATITYSITSGYNAKVTLAGNRTLSITNAAAGDYGTLIVTQDAVGSRTLTLPASSKVISGGAGVITLTTTASAIDVLSWFYDGTNYYWTYGKNYN